MLKQAFQKLLTNVTSKRFITLMIATWFVYEGIDIDPNWLLLSGFYIGIDTLKKEGVLNALSLRIQAKKNSLESSS
jgi:hypothetical protein